MRKAITWNDDDQDWWRYTNNLVQDFFERVYD